MRANQNLRFIHMALAAENQDLIETFVVRGARGFEGFEQLTVRTRINQAVVLGNDIVDLRVGFIDLLVQRCSLHIVVGSDVVRQQDVPKQRGALQLTA